MSRVTVLDSLRGVAVIGILFMNIYYHALFEVGYSPLPTPPISDLVIDVINAVFIDGRFRTLFCLLFGVGLAILYDKHGRDNALPLLHSRLKWLLIFGLLHSVLIFSGDILVNYALAGFLVYRELGNNQDVILRKAKAYFVIGFAVLFVFSLIPTDPIYRGSEQYYEIVNEWQLGYGTQLIQQAVFTTIMFVFSLVCFVWVTAGIVLFGVYLYRDNFFREGLTKTQLTLTFAITLILSIIDAVIRVTSPELVELNMALATLSALFCALLYAHVIIKLVAKVQLFNVVFAPAGRMAFSLYILQSIVFALFFRYINVDFINQATRMDYLYLCVVFSFMQLAFAFIYFRLFNIGPIEWLWRKAYIS